MANYTKENIQAALESGLITDEDAQYLADALEPGTPWGGILGGAAGLAAGGMAGAKLGSKATQKFLPETSKLASNNIPEMVGGAALGGLGAYGGAELGDAMIPAAEGEGITGVGFYDEQNRVPPMVDQDMALRILIDPNASPEIKKKILAALQAQQEGTAQYNVELPEGTLTNLDEKTGFKFREPIVPLNQNFGNPIEKYGNPLTQNEGY